MTHMTTTDAHESDLHRHVWELLPWYMNGTLDEQAVAVVEAHLATCPTCQQELFRCRDMAAAVRTVREDGAWSPSSKHFTQVLDRIEAAEARETTAGRWWARGWACLLRCPAWLRETSGAVRWTLAVQGAVILALGVALVWQTPSLPPPDYQTLSSASERAAAERVRVVFAEDMTAGELRSLLVPLQAALVHGPTPAGVYTVEVPLASSAPEHLAPILRQLRAYPKVRLAEPVPAGSAP